MGDRSQPAKQQGAASKIGSEFLAEENKMVVDAGFNLSVTSDM